MHKIVFCILLAFECLLAHAQSTYKLTYVVLENINFKDAAFKTELRIKNGLTQYSHYRKPGGYQENGITMTTTHHKYINNLNLNTGTITEQRQLANGVLLKATWTPDYEWEIRDKFKTINGYKTQMAVSKSIEVPEDDQFYHGRVRAWFTTEIPVSSGPVRYSGLPGLILELEYEKFAGKVTLEKIEKDVPLNFEDISSGSEVEKEDVIYFNHKNKEKIRKIKKR